MQKTKIAIGAILVMLLLATFVLVQPALAKPHIMPRDISVPQAYAMIKHQSRRNPVLILDVRNQSEYNINHLYDAALIPLHELETRMGELEDHLNNKVIVYCRLGGRSEIAAGILADNGFTEVYNMVGGITAWIEAGYPIYTTYHDVTVHVVGKHVSTQINPLLIQTVGDSCGCGCSMSTPNTNVSIVDSTTVLQENGIRSTITLIVNGTEIEITTLTNVIANETFVDKDQSKTLLFTDVQVSNNLGLSTSSYKLSYYVETRGYYFRTETTLTPLQNSEGYNYSSTHVTFSAKDNSGVQTLEFVRFNSSVALSQLYSALSDVAKVLGKLYRNQGLKDIADNYHEIAKNLNQLSEVIRKELGQYNSIIVESNATIEDARILICAFGLTIGYAVVFYCTNPLQPTWVIQGACCAALSAIVLTVIGVCIASLGLACAIAIVAAILASWAALATCYTTCPSMTVCVSLALLWFYIDLVCQSAW